MSDGFQEFGFGSGDENVGLKSKRFKGKEGETYRVSFVWLGKKDGGEYVRFVGCMRHYVPNVGYFLHNGPEFSRIAGGPPKQTVATILCVWPTTRNGKINKEAFRNGEGIEVKPWVFSAERYDQLRRRNEEFPLNEFDLTIACTDTQYQKMDLSPCRESLFRTLLANNSEKGKSILAEITAAVKDIETSIEVDMAREMTLAQIREKLGGATASPASGGGGAVENVDGLLDNLLDD